jgi:glycosyltransferase involved in cell wall biosynthesis
VTADDIRARMAAARGAFDAIDMLVAPSKSLADEFMGLGFPGSKMFVLDYGFEPIYRDTRRPPPQTPLRFGYVGSIVWHKGLHLLIDAARRLPPDRFRVEIFGDPAVSPGYAEKVRHAAAGLPVTFRGGFDPSRAAEIFSEFDVLVVPSIWLENSPLVIHEAFMSGVPVIGARMGGIPDLVTDGDNGLLYDATSPDALAGAMRQLIDTPERVVAMQKRMPYVKSISTDAWGWLLFYAKTIKRNITL